MKFRVHFLMTLSRVLGVEDEFIGKFKSEINALHNALAEKLEELEEARSTIVQLVMANPNARIENTSPHYEREDDDVFN